MAPAHRLITLALVSLVTIVAFEAMAISTAMPAVARDLDAIGSYGLAFSFMFTAELLGIVLAGVWSDRHGPLPSLFAGQLLMALGSAVAGLAVSFPMLLVGRVVAGLGGGLILVALYVVIGRAYPDAMRPRVFSWIAAAWVLPAILGPVVAAWLASHWSWRWVFLIVVAPIAVTLLVVTAQRARLGEDSDRIPSPPGNRARHRRLALLGLVIAVGAGVFQWAAEQLVPLDPVPLVAVILGLLAVGYAAPRLVPAGTLRMASGLPSVMLSRFLLTASFNGAIAFIPLMLVGDRHLGVGTAGIMLTIGSLGWAGGSWLQGRELLHDHRSGLVTTGGLCVATGIALLSAVAAFDLPYPLVGAATTICGLGMGMAMSAISTLALSLSAVRDHGRASSSLQLSDVLGSVMGISVTGAIFASLHRPNASNAGVFALMWLVLALVATLVVPAGQRTRT